MWRWDLAASAVLAGALSAWLTQRTSDIKLTISDRDGHRVELDANHVRDTPQLLEQVARRLDGASLNEHHHNN
jgi:hypothetical protein